MINQKQYHIRVNNNYINYIKRELDGWGLNTINSIGRHDR